MFEDRTLTCRDCGNEFVFSASEQEFFAEREFTNDPSRCPECRASRKQNRSRSQREMHPAVCATCGVETQVPFKPSGDRPVYCSDCFAKNKSRY